MSLLGYVKIVLKFIKPVNTHTNLHNKNFKMLKIAFEVNRIELQNSTLKI